MHVGVHVNGPLLVSDFSEVGIFSTDFRKISNIKFHANYYSGNRVPCGRTDGRTERHDVANSRFLHFANASKNATWNPNDFGPVFLK